MSREVVHTNQAPAAVGPYSQAIVANGFVFTAGQGGLIPGTKSIIEGGIQAQTRQVMENLKAVLEAAGSGFDKVVKSNVYMVDLKDFGLMNEIYGSYFGDKPPARTTVQVAALPLGLIVEIEMVATV
jgi:2-iminobutanoate/2-iminopropanoate deaminase